MSLRLRGESLFRLKKPGKHRHEKRVPQRAPEQVGLGLRNTLEVKV